MSNYASIVKVAGMIGTAVAAVTAFLVLTLVQTGAQANVERADTTASISATMTAPALGDVESSQVDLICSLAHIGPEQAKACEQEKAKAAKHQQAETASRH